MDTKKEKSDRLLGLKIVVWDNLQVNKRLK